MYDERARGDFSRARRKAFLQRVRNWFSGKSDTLLPFDQVRATLPIKGQRYIGLRSVPIDQIVGSMGRYHDFNRAFLPTQDHTQDRWINIDRAYYRQVALPPIEVYKVGEVYFIQDGNHRVSVARMKGLNSIEAYVTEIDIPVRLTTDTQLSDLKTKQETAEFLERTGLKRMFPEAEVEITLPGEIKRLFQHIDTHSYYLGLERGVEPKYEEAVRSWYTEVYVPLVKEIEQEGLMEQFPGLTRTDLYLLVSEYQWVLREVQSESAAADEADRRFTETLSKISPAAEKPGRRVSRTLKNAPWLDQYILERERREFEKRTGLQLKATIPGSYSKLVRHIQDHRWYLGIEGETSWFQAVDSWYENVYLPARVLIDELDILSEFPNRTETDLYLWIVEFQKTVSDNLDWDISMETAAENLVGGAVDASTGTPVLEEGHEPSRPNLSRQLLVDILVPFGRDDMDLIALDQALVVASRNNGRIHGLHVLSANDEGDTEVIEELAKKFEERCREQAVPGRVAVDRGKIAKSISERAGWVDLIVLHLSHPPAERGLNRIQSGIRYLLRRSGKPLLAVPGKPTDLKKILLGYDGSPLADEALYLSSRLVTFWEGSELVVVTSSQAGHPSAGLLARAQEYLDSYMIDATYVRSAAPAPEAILEAAHNASADMIIMGGYGKSGIAEMALGSTIESVLQGSSIPVLIRS